VLAGAAGVELVADMLKASTELDAGAGATAEVAEISEAIKGAEGILDSARNARPIDLPFGPQAIQELSAEAIIARDKARSGGILYRIGTRGINMTGDQAQFWSLRNPLSTPGYAAMHGVPSSGMAKPDFIEMAVLKNEINFITRASPPYGTNPGGAVEVVVPKGGVIIKSHASL
jgi:hypothetical protein